MREKISGKRKRKKKESEGKQKVGRLRCKVTIARDQTRQGKTTAAGKKRNKRKKRKKRGETKCYERKK